MSKHASFVEGELSILKSIFCGNLQAEESSRSIEQHKKFVFCNLEFLNTIKVKV